MKGILGKKAGMTHLFTNDGKAIPVTLIEVLPNTVMQVKTTEKDGYTALKLGVFDKKEQRATKADLGRAKKANTTAKYYEAEIRDMTNYELGSKIDASIFANGEVVDVIGTSKGRGFAGVIKRHHQGRGPETHGSKFHRSPGSLGSISGQVFKTKKLPGRLGGISSTQVNLPIVLIDLENNVIGVKGSIPGPTYSYVMVKTALNKSIKAEPTKLVDIKEEQVKNELLIEAKHVGAKVSTAMSIDEMKSIIAEATIKHAEEIKVKEELAEKASHLGIVNPGKMSLADLKAAVAKAEEIEAKRKAKHEEEMAAKAAAEATEAAKHEEPKAEEAAPAADATEGEVK